MRKRENLMPTRLYFDRNLWLRFRAQATLRGTSGSAMLRELISETVERLEQARDEERQSRSAA